VLLPALFILLTACQTPPLSGKAHCPPVPAHLLAEAPTPAIKLAEAATNQQVIEEGIRPLYQWGAEGWARVRQIRHLQDECRGEHNRK
jgi:hypothetical protein